MTRFVILQCSLIIITVQSICNSQAFQAKMKLFSSKNLVLHDEIINGGILVNENGKIEKIFTANLNDLGNDTEIIDFGEKYLMAGIIDTHVHINEPGRTDWEGFETATKAAAAGGITTIIDMPLNSIPPTTSVENLRVKVEAALGKTYVDVGFWGGVVPGNQGELLDLVNAGVVGFKCFMTPSGVDEFAFVDEEEIDLALKTLNRTKTTLAFHAELHDETIKLEGDPTKYKTYLDSKPPTLELHAIKRIIAAAQKYNVDLHIVHLSAAEGLGEIKSAKARGLRISVETCHHYLSLVAEEVPDKATQFKCSPPIRELKNRELLWGGIEDGIVDLVVSDHSPSTIDLKLLNTGDEHFGDFIKAWGGIASLQFGLSLFWTQAKQRSLPIFSINKFMSRAPAKLAGLHNSKGKLLQNYDADFVVWNPNETFQIEKSIIQHKNKITPYLGKELHGKVWRTYVRGEMVYEDGKEFPAPRGKLLVNI